MCEIGEFKLCTCSGEIDESKPHWILERLSVNKNEIEQVTIGMYRHEYMINLGFVIDKLNTGNPFDFEYKPRQKDMLSLNFDDVAFTLIYTNGKWREFDDDYPGLEENQKDFIDSGEISLDFTN